MKNGAKAFGLNVDAISPRVLVVDDEAGVVVLSAAFLEASALALSVPWASTPPAAAPQGQFPEEKMGTPVVARVLPWPDQYE